MGRSVSGWPSIYGVIAWLAAALFARHVVAVRGARLCGRDDFRAGDARPGLSSSVNGNEGPRLMAGGRVKLFAGERRPWRTRRLAPLDLSPERHAPPQKGRL